MDTEELQRIEAAAEAEEQQPEPEVYPPGEGPEPNQGQEEPEVDMDAALPMVSQAVLMVGNLACARFEVTPISDQEATAVGAQLINCAKVFEWEANPKIMAVVMLGAVTIGVTAPRMAEYREKQAAKAAEPSDPDQGETEHAAPEPAG